MILNIVLIVVPLIAVLLIYASTRPGSLNIERSTTISVANFTMVPSGGATTVTWKMTGPSAFMTELIGVFMNMDKMIGSDFDTRPANLKKLAEE